MKPRLEKIIIAFLFALSYFIVIYHPGDPVFIGQFNNQDGSLYFVRGIDVIVSLIIFYLVAFSFIQKLFLKKRVISFIIWSLVLLAGVSALEYLLDRVTLDLFNLPTGPGEISDKMMAFSQRNIYYSTVVPGNLMVYVLAVLYGVSRDWIGKSRRQSQLVKEKMSADIDFLRSQINPHFFFNSLNNIYAITQRNKDTEAGEAITRLADVMRYMIYDSNVEFVSLRKEIDSLQQYIDLVRLKFAKDDPLEITVSAESKYDGFSISPLLLLPFVENSCKHGLTTLGHGFITIDLTMENNQLTFTVVNSMNRVVDTLKKHSGIGLDNVRKRLELLYPGKHTLNIEEDEERFTVILVIDLGE